MSTSEEPDVYWYAAWVEKGDVQKANGAAVPDHL
jgi:hypothetical protein